MQQNVAFTSNQGLHCLPRQNRSSEKEIQYFLEIITCDQSIYTTDHPGFTVSNHMAGLWLRVGNKKIIFLFLNQNICCGYSKEPSQWDGCFEHPKHELQIMVKNFFYNFMVNFLLSKLVYIEKSMGLQRVNEVFSCHMFFSILIFCKYC